MLPVRPDISPLSSSDDDDGCLCDVYDDNDDENENENDKNDD